MRILSHEIVGDRIVLTTDNVSRPVFSYRKDKFRSRADLRKEMRKSVVLEARRKDRSRRRVEDLESDL